MDEPVSVTVEIPPEQIAAFHGLMNEIATYTGRSLPSIVEQATVYFLQSAGKVTKLGKKRRPVENNPDKKPKYRFKVYRQGIDPLWITTDERMDAQRLVKNRGLAKNTWKALIGAASRKNTSFVGESSSGAIAKSVVSTMIHKQTHDIAITVTNRLGYMPIIAPNVLSEGMSKAKNRMDNYLLRKMQSDMEKKWRS